MTTIPLNYVGRVLGLLRPYSRLAAGSVVLTILCSLAALLIPWPLKIVVDNVLEKHPLPLGVSHFLGQWGAQRGTLLLMAVGGGLIVALATNVLHVISNYVNTKIDQYLTLDFRSHLFLHAQRMSLAFHDQRRAGMMIYMINSQGDAPSGLMMTIPMLAESALTLMGMFWISFRMDWQLSLVSLAVVPFLYYSVGYYATTAKETSD